MEKRSTGASPVTVISGMAGLLTAVAALVGLLVTFGVIGGKDSDKSSTSVTSSPGEGASTEGTTNTASVSSAFEVSPKELTLTLLAPKGNVDITNAGSGPMSVQPASVSGSGAAQFAVKDVSCIGAPIGADDTCQMAVTFTPGSSTSEARLIISVKGAPKQTVSLHGKPL